MKPAAATNDKSYLTQQHFLQMLLVAACLHILVLVGWGFMPSQYVEKVPVRILNIKLGDNENEQEVTLQSKGAAPTRDVASFVGSSNEPISEQEVEVPQRNMQAVISSLDQMLAKKFKDVSERVVAEHKAKQPANAIKQYVRDVPAATGAGGSRLGTSSAATAEAMARYEQMLSAWIQRFKIYPQAARNQGVMGKAILRLRIDRAGQVRYYALEQSTGSALLDEATLQMIRNANPVPAVPDEYPEGNLLEFKIPVSYDFE